MNSKWQIHRVGLLDFWYYDEEEFYNEFGIHFDDLGND